MKLYKLGYLIPNTIGVVRLDFNSFLAHAQISVLRVATAQLGIVCDISDFFFSAGY